MSAFDGNHCFSPSRAAALIALSLLTIAPGFSADDKAQTIAELMQRFHDSREFYGAVLVAERENVIYQKAFGFANLEWKIPNSLDTRFALASLSKPFAATLAVLAAKAGELSLDDKVSGYLPEYPKEKGDRMTIRHLLMHTSGIPIGIPPQYDRRDLYQNAQCRRLTKDQYIDLISSQDLLFEPGTQYQYSNFGYSLLAMVLEKAAGKPYSELLRERIFEPLGMSNTSTATGVEIIETPASRYYYWFGRGPELAPFYGQGSVSGMGAGDIYSTVGDLHRFDRALYSDDFMPGEYREIMFAPGLANNGLGWIIEDMPVGRGIRTARVVKQEGGAEGTSTCMLRFVEDGFLIVILSNYTEPYFLRTRLARPMRDIAPKIAAILYDEAYELPGKPAAYEMMLLARATGWEKTEKVFREELDADSSNFDFSVEEFHWAGFSLYNNLQANEALPLFSFAERFLDVANYSDEMTESSTNCHYNFLFDYGRSYMQLKDWENAITKLEQAISVDKDDPLGCWAYINYCRQKMDDKVSGQRN